MIKKYDYEGTTLETLEMPNGFDKTIFLIHGITADFDNLKDITQKFKDSFNIYSINLPAHGKSGMSPQLMHIKQFADIIVKYIQDKQLTNIYLIGHSMGGVLAMLISQRIYDRLNRILLISPANLTTLDIKDKLEYAFSNSTLMSKITFIKYSYHKPFKALLNKEFRANSAKWAEEHKQFFPQYKELGKELMDESLLKEEGRLIKKFDKPLGLLCGKSDNIINQKKIYSYFETVKPNTDILKVPKCGHNPWRENKEQTLEAIESFFNNYEK
ncbi:alpha/beta hydrolase [Mycoplasmopsis ciconiae]|uniref:Alpha/beta hydrolase n=1 Tax=Mycoplasmopsis ciconiae TaxID=561067 RepID=A0ABU7ML25_9BACT|nr:alpha/beta hydrolase [Mycoplasmopsis ciconiae]